MEYELNGHNGVYINRKILFAPPEKDIVAKIKDIRQEIAVEHAEVIEGGNFVLVNGCFVKTIEYFTARKDILNEDEEDENQNQNKDKDEKDEEDKKEVECDLLEYQPEAIAVDGVARHTTVWIPFEILIRVEGAKLEDKVIVEDVKIKTLYTEKQIQEILENNLIIGVLINDFIDIYVKIEGEK